MAGTSKSRPTDAAKYVEYDEFVDFQIEKTRTIVKRTDLLTTLMALGSGLLAYLFVFVICDHWVIEGGFGYGARITMLTIALGLGAAVFVWRVVMPMLKSIHPLYAARVIEKSGTQLQSNLVNFVDVKLANAESAPVVMKAMQKRAAVELSHIDVEEAVDHRPLLRLSYIMLGIVVVSAVYIFLSPKSVLVSIQRALMPASSIAAATKTTIDNVEPGDIDVPARSRQLISAEIRGEAADQAQILFTTADRKYVDEPVVMRRESPGLARFVGELNGENGKGLLQSLTYRLVAGDARTENYKLNVIQPPSARVEEVLYVYPKYMEIADRIAAAGDIDAWEGTIVTVKAVANMPIVSARVVLTDGDNKGEKGEEISMMISEGTKLSATWKLDFRSDGSAPRYYHIQVRTESQRKDEIDADPTRYSLRIRPDQRPEVVLLDPTSDLTRPANAIIPLVVQASDPDFKLRSIVLRGSRGGDPLFVQDVKLFDEQLPVETITDKYNLNLEPLGLKAGEWIQLWIEAKDNKQPTANRASTTPIKIVIEKPVSAEEVQKQLAKDENEQQEQLARNDGPKNEDQTDPAQPREGDGSADLPPPNQDSADSRAAKPGESSDVDANPKRNDSETDAPPKRKRSSNADALKRLLNKEQAEEKERNQQNDREKDSRSDDKRDDQPPAGAGAGANGQGDAKDKQKSEQSGSQQSGDAEDSDNGKGDSSTDNRSDSQVKNNETADSTPQKSSQDKEKTRGGKDSSENGQEKNSQSKTKSKQTKSAEDRQSPRNHPKPADGQKDQPDRDQAPGAESAGENQENSADKQPGKKQQPEQNVGKKSKGSDEQNNSAETHESADSNNPADESNSKDKPGDAEDKGDGQEPQQKPQPNQKSGNKGDTNKPQPEPQEKQTAGQKKSENEGSPNDNSGDNKGEKKGDQPREQGKPDDSTSMNQKEAAKKGEKAKPEKGGGNDQQSGDKSDDQEKSDEHGEAGDGKDSPHSDNEKGKPGDQAAKQSNNKQGKKSQNDKVKADQPAGDKSASPDDQSQQGAAGENEQQTGETQPDSKTNNEQSAKKPNDRTAKKNAKPAGDSDQPKSDQNAADADKTAQGATDDAENAQPNPQGKQDPDRMKDVIDEPLSEKEQGRDDQQAEKRPDQPVDVGNKPKKGDGRKKGQRSDQPDAGEDGGGAATDQGKKGGNKQGPGDKSPKAGEDNISDKPTGESSDDVKGNGSAKKPGKGDKKGRDKSNENSAKSDDGDKPSDKQEAASENQSGGDANSQTGNKSSNKQKGGQPSGQPGGGEKNPGGGESANPEGKGTGDPSSSQKRSGDGGSGQNGGTQRSNAPGNGPRPDQPTDLNAAAENSSSPSEPPETPENLEHLKHATNLVLERLKSQLERGEVDQALLDELGWKGKDDVEKFVRYLEDNLNSDADDDSAEAQARRMQFEETLKNLHIDRDTKRRAGGAGKERAIEQIGSKNVPPPREYRKIWESYTRSLSSSSDQSEKNAPKSKEAKPTPSPKTDVTKKPSKK